MMGSTMHSYCRRFQLVAILLAVPVVDHWLRLRGAVLLQSTD